MVEAPGKWFDAGPVERESHMCEPVGGKQREVFVKSLGKIVARSRCDERSGVLPAVPIGASCGSVASE